MEQILVRPKPQMVVRQTRERVMEKEDVVTETQTTTKRLRVELESVQTVVDKIRKDFRHHRLLNQKLQRSVEEKKTQLNELIKHVNDHGSNFGALAAHVDIGEEKLTAFKEKFEELQQDVRASLDLTPLDRAIAKAMTIVEQLLSEATTLDGIHVVLKSEIEKLNAEVTDTELSNEQHKAEIEELMLQHDEAKAQLQAAIEEAAELSDEEQSLANELAKLLSDTTSMNTERTFLTTECTAAEETLLRLTEEVASQQQLVESKKQCFAEECACFQRKEKELKDEHDSLEVSLHNLQQEYSSLEIQYFKKLNEKNETEATLATTEQAVACLQRTYILKQQECNEQVSTHSLQLEELQQAETVLSSVKEEISTAENDIKHGLESVKNTTLELFDLKTEEFRLQHALHKEQEQAAARRREVQEELATVNRENVELEENVAICADKVAASEAELVDAKNKAHQLIQLCIEADADIIKTQEQINAVISHTRQHESLLAQLSNKLEKVVNDTVQISDMSIENQEKLIVDKKLNIEAMTKEIYKLTAEATDIEKRMFEKYIPTEDDWIEIEKAVGEKVAISFSQSNYERERHQIVSQIRELRKDPAEVFPSIIVQRNKELDKLKMEYDELLESKLKEDNEQKMSHTSVTNEHCTVHTRSRTRTQTIATGPSIIQIQLQPKLGTEAVMHYSCDEQSQHTESTDVLLFKETSQELGGTVVEEELDITPLFNECALPPNAVPDAGMFSNNQVDKKYGKKRPLASHHRVENDKDLRLKNDMHTSGRHNKSKSRSARKVLRSSSKSIFLPTTAKPVKGASNKLSQQQGDWFNDENDYFVFGK